MVCVCVCVLACVCVSMARLGRQVLGLWTPEELEVKVRGLFHRRCAVHTLTRRVQQP
jgi:hypothetical protein